MTIAIWCILIAQILPYIAFGFVKGLDPEQPRFHVGDLRLWCTDRAVAVF